MIDNLRMQTNDEPYLSAVVAGLEALSETNSDLKSTLEVTERKLSECWDYIRGKAQKESKNGSACIEDKVVYGWAAEFFHMSDDQYENLKKSETKELKLKQKKVIQEEPQEDSQEDLSDETEGYSEEEIEEEEVIEEVPAPVKSEVKKESKAKENLKGQMNIFDFLGA